MQQKFSITGKFSVGGFKYQNCCSYPFMMTSLVNPISQDGGFFQSGCQQSLFFWIRETKLESSSCQILHITISASVTLLDDYPVLICASQRVLFMVTQDLEQTVYYSKGRRFDSQLLRLYVGESLCKILHPKIKANVFHNVNLC